jgi:hypothetical protein
MGFSGAPSRVWDGRRGNREGERGDDVGDVFVVGDGSAAGSMPWVAACTMPEVPPPSSAASPPLPTFSSPPSHVNLPCSLVADIASRRIALASRSIHHGPEIHPQETLQASTAR